MFAQFKSSSKNRNCRVRIANEGKEGKKGKEGKEGKEGLTRLEIEKIAEFYTNKSV